ncbi:MAG TPA: glycosyltransferase [Candidatus Nanoarchaeia archaeon]|nr:glycosyltransferase [Candidatus Nanoarchaeia archaeon]
MPAISVIIPAFNEEKYIAATLSALEKQTFTDYETIVVANGCTDDTEKILKNSKHHQLRHLSLPQANVSVARNAGALNAQGNILVFLDADTQLAHNSLQKIAQEFTTEYGVATTKTAPDIPSWKFKAALAFKNLYNQTNLYQGCSGVLVCRKKDFHDVDGYPPTIVMKEHRKLILKLKEKGKYTCIDTKVTTSMRRFEQWGLGKSFLFWVKQWAKDKTKGLQGMKYETVR